MARSRPGSTPATIAVLARNAGRLAEPVGERPNGVGANPQKRLAAGYSARFLGAMKAASGKAGGKIPRGPGITAQLAISPPGVDRDAGTRLMEAAEVWGRLRVPDPAT